MSINTAAYPYDSIVRIIVTIGGQQFQGSGVLITPDEVLTATHVIYSPTAGSATTITVTPGYQTGAAPFGTAYGIATHYNNISYTNDLITLAQSQLDYAVIHLSHPFNSAGTMSLWAGSGAGNYTVSGYPASAGGAQVDQNESMVVDSRYTLYDGTSIGAGSSGGPVWFWGYDGLAHVAGVVSSGSANGQGYFAQLTTAAVNQINAWVLQDDGSVSGNTPMLAVANTSTSQAVAAIPQTYSGPVAGLTQEYVNISSQNLNISVSTPNWFIHAGSGNDAIQASGGYNVLDGGGGSNFLTGGNGVNTFYLDDRNAAGDIWSTITNAHGGDNATIWGVTPDAFGITWQDGQGANGFTGLTVHAAAPGQPTASLTLSGMSYADITSGRVSVNYGIESASGSAYMLLTVNS